MIFIPHLMAGRVFSFRNSPHLSSVPTSQKWTGILFSFTIELINFQQYFNSNAFPVIRKQEQTLFKDLRRQDIKKMMRQKRIFL